MVSEICLGTMTWGTQNTLDEAHEQLDYAIGEGVNFIDSQGSAQLAEIRELAESYGAELRLARVKPAVLALLKRDGVIDAIGEANLFGNVFNAVVDQLPDETRT